MNTKIRLTRKPLTTALWALLVAAMAVLLSVGAAMMYSSGSLAGILDLYHTSIAVRTDRAVYEFDLENGVRREYENKSFFQDHVDQLERMDSVEGVYFHTLTGAYCPQLSPKFGYGSLHNIDESYAGAAVIGTITRMTEPEYWDEYYDMSRIGGSENAQMCSIGIEVKVEQYVSGNADFTKWNAQSFDGCINMSFDGVISEDLELLQVGERYLLAGDFDRGRTYLDANMEGSGHAWLLNPGTVFFQDGTAYTMRSISQITDGDGNSYVYDATLSGPTLTRIDGSLEEFLEKPENEQWAKLLEDQQTVQHCLPVLGTEALETMHCFVTQNANIVAGRFFTQEEYAGAERVCILNESAALEAGIAVGDTITLSQYLCHNYTFSVADPNMSVFMYAPDGMLNNPTVGEFQPDTVFVTEDEPFTVVGLYRLRDEWSDGSYSITPNTIFIPQGAQIEGAFGGLASSAEIERKNLDGTTQIYDAQNEGAAYGIYLSVKLKNGKVEDFENEIEGSSFAGQFLTFDQGFGKIQSTLNDISASALKLFGLVAAGWFLLLALYALLYQGTQRQNLGIMRSLGASPKLAGKYLFESGMTVAGVGVVLGTLIAGAVMDTVKEQLFLQTFGTEISKYSNSVLSQDAIDQMVMGSQLPLWVILAIGAAQLALFALVLRRQADRMSKCPPRALLSK